MQLQKYYILVWYHLNTMSLLLVECVAFKSIEQCVVVCGNLKDKKGGQMTNNCEFYVLLLIFWNMKFVTGYGWKQISWSNVTLQTIASYSVSSVVFVFSMLSLGRILISNLVVANLLMYVFTSRYDSTLLGHAFFTPKVFLHEISSLLQGWEFYCNTNQTQIVNSQMK